LSDRDPREEAAILAGKAKADALAMRELAGNPQISDDIVGFHAQQAVEKWLKAVIGASGARFEYTHDLRHLVELAKAAAGEFPFEIGEVIALTEYAVPLRYDELLDSEPLERERTVKLVDDVEEWATAIVDAAS
jgi:HEPN domain-containing protein